MVEVAILQFSWPSKSFHRYPLPLQDGTVIDAFMFRTSNQSHQDPENEGSSQFREPLRTGKELGETEPPREAGGEPLLLTPGPVLFPTLCNITPASWAEAAAPSKMSHQL